MRVWLLTIGEPLPTDPGDQRLLRTSLLSQVLSDRGHDVLWWSSNFIHMLKTKRSPIPDTEVLVDERQRIVLLDGGGYKRNVSVARWRDHVRLAERFEALCEKRAKPDIIVASFPTVELALAAVRYGKRHAVPVIIDVRDFWPDAMIDLLPRLLRPVGEMVTMPMRAKVRETCAGATAITGHAPSFVDWGLQHANRDSTALDRSFPHGYPVATLTTRERDAALESLAARRIDLSPNRTTAVFIGTIGNQTEIDPILAAAAFLRDYPRAQFVIAGTGTRMDEYRQRAENLTNVIVPGWLNRAEINVLLTYASVGLVPYPHRDDWLTTIPNKFPEYLSAGLPLLVSLTRGKMLDFAIEHRCGMGYDHDPKRLADAIRRLGDVPEETAALRRAALQAFEQHFRADVVYGAMADLLEEIVEAAPAATSPAVG